MFHKIAKWLLKVKGDWPNSNVIQISQTMGIYWFSWNLTKWFDYPWKYRNQLSSESLSLVAVYYSFFFFNFFLWLVYFKIMNFHHILNHLISCRFCNFFFFICLFHFLPSIITCTLQWLIEVGKFILTFLQKFCNIPTN